MNLPSLKLRVIQNIKTGDQPFLLAGEVADSFDNLRAQTLALTGHDFMSVFGDMFRDRNFVQNSPGSITNSLHKCGVAFDYNQGEPALRLVRENPMHNGELRTFWRTYLAISDHTKQAPSQFVAQHNGLHTENAGVWSGWALDYTALALSLGWERIPAHRDWQQKGHWTSREFWHYQYAKMAALGYDALMKLLYG